MTQLVALAITTITLLSWNVNAIPPRSPSLRRNCSDRVLDLRKDDVTYADVERRLREYVVIGQELDNILVRKSSSYIPKLQQEIETASENVGEASETRYKRLDDQLRVIRGLHMDIIMQNYLEETDMVKHRGVRNAELTHDDEAIFAKVIVMMQRAGDVARTSAVKRIRNKMDHMVFSRSREDKYLLGYEARAYAVILMRTMESLEHLEHLRTSEEWEGACIICEDDKNKFPEWKKRLTQKQGIVQTLPINYSFLFELWSVE
eukprot:Lankesteria_metandrocarpae@DN3507_c0_g1_i2.p1